MARTFREATDLLLECGLTLDMIAQASGVTVSSIHRARTEAGHRRSPPKAWHRIVGDLADEYALTLQHNARRLIELASEMADA